MRWPPSEVGLAGSVPGRGALANQVTKGAALEGLLFPTGIGVGCVALGVSGPWPNSTRLQTSTKIRA